MSKRQPCLVTKPISEQHSTVFWHFSLAPNHFEHRFTLQTDYTFQKSIPCISTTHLLNMVYMQYNKLTNNIIISCLSESIISNVWRQNKRRFQDSQVQVKQEVWYLLARNPLWRQHPLEGQEHLEPWQDRISSTKLKQKETSEHCCISEMCPSNPTTNQSAVNSGGQAGPSESGLLEFWIDLLRAPTVRSILINMVISCRLDWTKILSFSL